MTNTINYYDAQRNKIEGVFDSFVVAESLASCVCGVVDDASLVSVKSLRYVTVKEAENEYKWYSVEYLNIAPRTQKAEFCLTKEPTSVFITETKEGEIVKVNSTLYPETVYPEESVGGNLGKDTGQDIYTAVLYLIDVGCKEVHFSIRGGYYSACGFKQSNGSFQFIDYNKVSNEFKNLLREEKVRTLKDSITFVEYLLDKIDLPKVPFRSGLVQVSEFIVTDSEAREEGIDRKVLYLQDIGCTQIHVFRRRNSTGYAVAGIKNGELIDMCKDSNEFKPKNEEVTKMQNVQIIVNNFAKNEPVKIQYADAWFYPNLIDGVDEDSRKASLETNSKYLQDIGCTKIFIVYKEDSYFYGIAGLKDGEFIDMCGKVELEYFTRREITGHLIYGNEPLKIETADALTFNAHHSYQISVREGYDSFYTNINFQKGPVKENGHNGVTETALLAVLIDRLQCFQNSEFKCKENAVALTHLEDAMNWLNRRTIQRTLRNVEGTNQK